MSLDQDLRDIKVLEVEDIEKINSQAGSYQSKISNYQDKKILEINDYITKYKEKLIKSGENINILGNLICELDKEGVVCRGYSTSISSLKLKRRRTLFKKEKIKEIANLEITFRPEKIEGKYDDYPYSKPQFSFDKKTSSLDLILFMGDRWSEEKAEIKENTITNFVEKYASRIQEDLQKYGNSGWICLLKIFSSIPETIIEMYEKKEKSCKNLLDSVASLQKEISQANKP
jgi:hypothetical protein